MRGRPRCDRGSVAAEFAVTLPAVLLVLVVGISALGGAAQSVRLQDAAADAARLEARGESSEGVRRGAATARGAPAIAVTRRADLVCVTLTEPVRIAGIAAGWEASGRACALAGGR